MISLAAPWALAGLAAAAVLAWLHRLRRRPVPVEVPSLLFLEAESEEAVAPERVRVDAELLLGWTAIALLTLAAAGPVVVGGGGGVTVRVVVDVGPAMGARGADGRTAAERAQAVVEQIRRTLGRGDALERVEAEGAGLLPAVRAGEASLRVLVSDRRPAEAGPGLCFVGVGDPSARNAGIVAADVAVEGGERRVFATVWNDDDLPRETTLVRDGVERHRLRVPAHGAASTTFAERRSAPAAAPWPPVELAIDPAADALPADDRVTLDPAPVRVAFAPPPAGPGAAQAQAVRRALDAVAPGAWQEAATGPGLLWVGPREEAPKDAAAVLVLHPVPAGEAGVRAPADGPFAPLDPVLGRDLDPLGCALVYAPGLVAGGPWPILARRSAPGAVPLVVEWFPDPVAGAPAPADHPIWPLFVDDLLAAFRGRAGPAGYRLRGILDPAASSLGRDRAAFDPAVLARAPRDRRPRSTRLGGLLLLGGAACLALLWWGPRRRAPPAAS